VEKLHTNLSALPDTKLLVALRSEDTFETAQQLLKVQDISLKKDIMKLLLSMPLKDALSGINFDQLINGLLSVPDSRLQSQLIANLLLSNTYPAMLMVGMKEKSEYPQNAIVNKNILTYNFIKNLERKNRMSYTWYDVFSQTEPLSNEFGQKSLIPADVKNAYLMFAGDTIRKQVKEKFPFATTPSRNIDTKRKSYAIVSKTDGHMYLFDSDHRLVSRKSVLLGKDVSDVPFKVHDYPVKNDAGQIINFSPPKRTPRGLYAIEAR